MLGGLANGFQTASWDWKLEKTYHHFFTNDHAIIDLAKELGIEKDMLILSPITAVYWKQKQYPFDTPITILQFPGLPFIDRVRTGMTAALMKINPWWQPLESMTAQHVFQKINGMHAWNIIWKPLLHGKFGPYANQVAASWLWARLYKRTPRLGYFHGGFSHFVEVLALAVKKQGGIIHTHTPVTRILQKNTRFIVNNASFDQILITTPSRIAQKLIEFPKAYTNQLSSIPHLWAQTLILETKKPIMEKTYWLNITDESFPFLAVVAHTNMINKTHYGNSHITYIGNYLPDNHPFLTMTKEHLLKKFMPYLTKIDPTFDVHSISNSFLFTIPHAQPVHTKNYSKRAPTIQTPIPHVYLANLDSIYPWDR
jgi:protoporphyrinogen oxidase